MSKGIFSGKSAQGTMDKNKRDVNQVQRILVIFCMFFFLSSIVYAQSLPSVAVFSLFSNDLKDNISMTVDDLVYSFIRELRTYRIVDMRSDSPPLDFGVPDGTDYAFFGTMTSQPDGIKLELVLKGGPFGVTRLISRVYENSNRILLESRILVRDLFDQSIRLPDPDEPVFVRNRQEKPIVTDTSTLEEKALVSVTNIDSLAGSWRGEDGIEKIMLLRGGRGVAVLSSGVSLSLEVIVSNGDLIVRQKGSSNPRQFDNLPDPVAKQAVNVAPPLEWRFLISKDQKTLSGTKKTVIIKNDGKNILKMENDERPVSWVRD